MITGIQIYNNYSNRPNFCANQIVVRSSLKKIAPKKFRYGQPNKIGLIMEEICSKLPKAPKYIILDICKGK